MYNTACKFFDWFYRYCIAVLLLVSLPCASVYAQNSCTNSRFDNSFMVLSFECLNDIIMVKPDSRRADAQGWQYIQDNQTTAVDNDGIFNGSLIDPNGAINDDFEIYGIAFRETKTEIFLVITSEISRFGTNLSDASDGHIGYGDILVSFDTQSTNNFGYQSATSKLWGIHFSGSNTDSSVTMDGVYRNVRAKTVSLANDGYVSLHAYFSVLQALGGDLGLGDIDPDSYDTNGNGDFTDDFADNTFYSRNVSLNVISSGIKQGNIQTLNWTQLSAAGFDTNFLKEGTFIAFKFQKSLMVDECGVVGGNGSSCPKDCFGTPCGTAVLDSCGICGGNGSSCDVCGDGTLNCLDCAGVPFGGKVVDGCGVCGGDNSTCSDCAGIPNGSTVVDQCGVCGGNNSSCLDCRGIPNGGATIDSCGVCGGDGSSCTGCIGTIDQCGVCNGDNSSCTDCTGTPNGGAVVDKCGVCGGDGSSCTTCTGTIDQCGVCNGNNSTCADCSGVPNGGTKVDPCGVCGGDGSSCADCRGVPNGGATIDVCGVCGGGGKNSNGCCPGDTTNDSGVACCDNGSSVDICGVCGGDGSSCADCEGTPFGNKVIDQCGVCGGNGQSCLDCAGTPFGTKVIDECGVCGGDNSSCNDCEDQSFGNKTVDRCGVCGGDGTTCLDCAGIPNGDTEIDNCGICGGNGQDANGCCPGDVTNKKGQNCCADGSAKDVCGICGGDGKSCIDCAGIPFGTKTIDNCGVCGGDGTSCLDCESVDILDTQYTLDGTGLEQRLLLRKIVRQLKKRAKKNKKIQTFSDNLLLEGERLYLRNWEFTWSLPTVINNCENSTFCVTQSNEVQIQGYKANAQSFFNIQKKGVRKLKKVTKKKKTGKRFLKRGRLLVEKSEKLLDTIPVTADVCN